MTNQPTNPAYLEALEAVADAADAVVINAYWIDSGDYQIPTDIHDALILALHKLEEVTLHKHCAPAGEYGDLSDKLDALNGAVLALHNRVLELEKKL